MSEYKLPMSEIADMVRHWLRMRANGYLGQSYGNTLKDMLQKPIGLAHGDQLLRKLMQDVPILAQLPAGSVNLFAEELSKEHKRIIVDLGGTQVTIDSMGNVN